MAKVSATIPQGTRDFGPEIVRKRNYILDHIKNVFELYGFQPLETPAMENLETLTGKYGEEGNKLIFKILNNGLEHPSKQKKAREDFEKILEGKNSEGITERALRYDLTIPFARYVAMHQGEIAFPFKRYQMQPVWRADRPAKGRYREFFQCDADIVGSSSLLNEIELANICHDIFSVLKVKECRLLINHRHILAALAETCGSPEKFTDITIAIDKLEKIGMEKVKQELETKGLSSKQASIIEKYLSISGSEKEKIDQLRKLLGQVSSGKKGIEELEYILSHPACQRINLQLDLTLARGLNYYTGIIFEAKAPSAVGLGSIGGGGRYDDLTGLFGVPGIPGVGISFGVDRIYDMMDELNLFPSELATSTQVLFFNLGEMESRSAFELMQTLRGKGIRSEIYPESVKFDKQFKYAEKKNIPFIVIIGNKELEEKSCTIKDLRSGKQQSVSFENILAFSFA